MKICVICEVPKDESEYNRNAKSKDGVSSYCRDCANQLSRDWKKAHRPETAAYKRNRRVVSPEKEREREKKWRDTHQEERAEYRANFREKHPERSMLYDAKKRAKRKGLPFALVPEDIVIPKVCPVLGIELVFGTGKLHDASPTIDRIIPEKGYVKGNIAVMSHKANRIKCHSTLSELKRLVAWMEK